VYLFVVAFRHFGDWAVHVSAPLSWIVAFTG